ncbi:hypothetical protein J4E81_010317 [Alternaria sp. BMP 2799]|nr:hypothetical protein J4E81_010317 [Alternaria sp. BMP 2799]
MAEVIGLVASLITLAGASAQLATTLLDVANVIKSAEYEARIIAVDINGLSSYLTQLSMIVDTPNIKTEKLREITVVLIAACKTLIEDLKMLIGQPVQHDPARRAFTISMVRFRFRWMRVGPKVMFVKSLIDSFKTTIVVLVSTMNLAVVLERNAPESISESLKTQVESNIKFAEDATECLHYHTTVQQDEVPSFTPTVESSAATELEDATQGAGGELIVSRLRPSDERSLAVHDATLLTNPDFEPDDFALQIFHDCTQAIELQQMSSALAKDVLDYPTRKAAWNWNASGSSSVHERADSVSDAVDPKDEQLKREAAADAARYAERQAADMKDARIAEEKKAASEKAKLMLDAAQRTRNLAEEKAAEERKSIEAAHARALQEAKKAAEKLEKAKIRAPKTSAPIIFHDPVGRKFEGPWRLCSTWKGMEEFLQEICAGSAEVLRLKISGQYDLVRGDDVIILQGLWDSMVVPGSSITMRARTSAEKKVPWFRRSVGKGSG